ncbi:MAG: D-Ala-D-Ala carboxypeptidase family metallohydrolase [Snowella sp.]|nr:D-Ala-D-Ala carboxypeptidase family metallohydrolase [Snowella sp.]
MQHTITASTNTFLKKRPIQSTQLSENEKVAVPAGKIYPVEEYKLVEDGHFWVKLGYGSGEWYIYDYEEDGHWETTWESEEKDDPPSSTTNSAPVTSVIATPGTIDWSNGSQLISQYFTVGEVTKNDIKRRPKSNSAEEKNILALAKELDKIREDWGSAIVVTSWFRPSTRLGYPHDVNRSVRGAYDSQHIYGRGVDIQPAQGNIHKLQDWLDKDWFGALGYGAKRGFVHLDTRNGKGWKTGGVKGVRWNY